MINITRTIKDNGVEEFAFSSGTETSEEQSKESYCIFCSICGREHEKQSEYSECPDCFNGCSDPGYHQGKPCDLSC